MESQPFEQLIRDLSDLKGQVISRVDHLDKRVESMDILLRGDGNRPGYSHRLDRLERDLDRLVASTRRLFWTVVTSIIGAAVTLLITKLGVT